MPKVKESPGVGTLLVRLRDVPLKARLDALDVALKAAKTPREAIQLMSITIDPEDRGGRIAA